jgi:hypothetical protein
MDSYPFKDTWGGLDSGMVVMAPYTCHVHSTRRLNNDRRVRGDPRVMAGLVPPSRFILAQQRPHKGDRRHKAGDDALP